LGARLGTDARLPHRQALADLHRRRFADEHRSYRTGTEEVGLALDRRRAARTLGKGQESADGAEAVREGHDRATVDDVARGADFGPHGQLACDAVLVALFDGDAERSRK